MNLFSRTSSRSVRIHILLLLIASSLFFAQSCKKDEDNSAQPSYPVTYTFSEFANLSDIMTCDSNGPVHAPNHLSTTVPYIAYFRDSAYDHADEDYSGGTFTLLSGSQLRYRHGGFTETASYVRSGDRIYADGFNAPTDTVFLRISGDDLYLENVAYAYLDTAGGGQRIATGRDLYQRDVYRVLYRRSAFYRNDTIAVRTFDAVFHKQ